MIFAIFPVLEYEYFGGRAEIFFRLNFFGWNIHWVKTFGRNFHGTWFRF